MNKIPLLRYYLVKAMKKLLAETGLYLWHLSRKLHAVETGLQYQLRHKKYTLPDKEY